MKDKIEKEVEEILEEIELESSSFCDDTPDYFINESSLEKCRHSIIKLIEREKIKTLKEAESGFLKIFNEETDALKKRYEELVERECLKARIDEWKRLQPRWIKYDEVVFAYRDRIEQLKSQLEKIGE